MKGIAEPKKGKGLHKATTGFESILQVGGLEKPIRPAQDDIHEDEHLAEFDMSMGSLISRGIPWNSFSELEIQGIVKMHFEYLGFDIVWRHKDDPANEGGVDLDCRRETDKMRVLVAVKKKPKKEALAQVVELALEQADQRICVYLGGSSQSFRDRLASFEMKVEF